MKSHIYFVLFILLISACKTDNPPTVPCDELSIDNSTFVKGYGILAQLPGIWNGPVTSSTPLGSYPEWIVDFRPISAANISAKNELDKSNDIFMGFFIVKVDCDFYVAFRNGGSFANSKRNSYMVIDSVYESAATSFYRFIDFVAGKNRMYTDITFSNNSMDMHSYTNQFNNLSTAVSHMHWIAQKVDETSTQDAIANFNFPQKVMEVDFSETFEGLSESVFYSNAADPFPESAQPHVGVSNVTVNISNPATVNANNKVLIIISTNPLFNGFVFNPINLKYRSRYVFLDASNSASYEFNYMHPGSYYVNALYDVNGDFTFSSGDFMNSNFDVPFTLSPESTQPAAVNINFEIP